MAQEVLTTEYVIIGECGAILIKRLGITTEHSPTTRDENFILNCVSNNQITPLFIRDVSKVLGDNKINITRIYY